MRAGWILEEGGWEVRGKKEVGRGVVAWKERVVGAWVEDGERTRVRSVESVKPL